MKIGKIYNELLLSEDFKTQTEKFISQGYSKEIVDRYINDFKEIRDKKYKEARDKELPNLNVPVGEPRFNIDNYKTFKELEVLVDYVAGQRKFGSANFEDIKIDGEPIFKNKDVEIFYADTPRACIQYKGNKPYGWCVARSDSSNMFYNYRLQEHEPAFYFVKRIAATDKEFSFWNLAKDVFSGKFQDKYHFFVIQAIKNVKIGDENTKSYIVTSAMNDGDIQMSWSEIIEIAPELRGLQKIFEPKPLSPEEREKVNKYKKGLSDEEFARLPYKEKEYYMAVYVKMNKPLTYNQFAELPDDLKNKYIGFGIGLSDKQFELIKNNSKLVKRYAEITKRKWEEFVKLDYKDKDEDEDEDEDKFVFTSSEVDIISNETDLINKTNSYGISYLLANSKEPDKIINIVLNNPDLINKLNPDSIYTLINHSKEKDKTINILLSTEGFIKKFGNRVDNILFWFSKEKDKIINILLSTEGYINKLSSQDILDLLLASNKIGNNKTDKVINILLSTEGFINKLDLDGIRYLLQYSSDPDKVIDILGDKGKGFLSHLRTHQMSSFLNNSKEKDKIINILLSTEGVINRWYSHEGWLFQIGILFEYSSDPDKVINTLLNNGVPKDYINDVIKRYRIRFKLKTDLIPENYQLKNRIRNILKDI